jgi:hypothetical protein
MRKLSVLVLVAAMCCVLSTLGCDKIVESLSQSKKPVTITSADGTVQVTVPGNWKKMTNLHEDGMLQAAAVREENYIVVIPDNKADLDDEMTLEGHSDITRSAILENIKDGQQTAGPIMLTINGRLCNTNCATWSAASKSFISILRLTAMTNSTKSWPGPCRQITRKTSPFWNRSSIALRKPKRNNVKPLITQI